MTLTDNVVRQVSITAQEYGKDLQLDLPSDPRHQDIVNALYHAPLG
jgi:hypothetical protein